MKILFVSAVLPYPLYSGGQVRIYNLLKKLSTKHEITLCAFTRHDSEKKYISELSFLKKVITVHRGRARHPRYITKSILGPYPLLWESYHNSQMESLLADELAKGGYDLVHLEPGYVWPSLPKTSVPVVVGEHNVEHTIYADFVKQVSLPFLRPPMNIDVAKMKFWEKKIWKEAHHVIAVSDEDKKEIVQASDQTNVSVVPNGVDIESFPYQVKKISTSKPVFLFVGSFAWMQNRDALEFLVRDIWPSIMRAYPGASLRVVGRQATAQVKELASSPGVQLFSRVETIQEEFAKADILLAPIRIGGGTKYKVLEAMASGVAVVTTTQGAAGLQVVDKKEVLIADDAQAFIKAVSYALEHPKETASMASVARAHIEREYSWDQIARRLDTVWKTYENH